MDIMDLWVKSSFTPHLQPGDGDCVHGFLLDKVGGVCNIDIMLYSVIGWHKRQGERGFYASVSNEEL